MAGHKKGLITAGLILSLSGLGFMGVSAQPGPDPGAGQDGQPWIQNQKGPRQGEQGHHQNQKPNNNQPSPGQQPGFGHNQKGPQRGEQGRYQNQRPQGQQPGSGQNPWGGHSGRPDSGRGPGQNQPAPGGQAGPRWDGSRGGE